MKIHLLLVASLLLLVSCQAPPDILVIQNNSDAKIQVILKLLLPVKEIYQFTSRTLVFITNDRKDLVHYENDKIIIDLESNYKCKLSFPYSHNNQKLYFYYDYNNSVEEISVVSEKHSISAKGYSSIFSIFTLKPSLFQDPEYELIIN